MKKTRVTIEKRSSCLVVSREEVSIVLWGGWRESWSLHHPGIDGDSDDLKYLDVHVGVFSPAMRQCNFQRLSIHE